MGARCWGRAVTRTNPSSGGPENLAGSEPRGWRAGLQEGRVEVPGVGSPVHREGRRPCLPSGPLRPWEATLPVPTLLHGFPLLLL